jgi:hypothetical protein
MAGYPYQGIYDPFGYTRRNGPVELPDRNPLPANAMSADTGNAGADGYTVLSRASRIDGWRPDVGGAPEFLGPNLED